MWLARDPDARLYLFQGQNQPHWIGGRSMSREDGTCEFVAEVAQADWPELFLAVGTAVQVVLTKATECKSS